MYYVTIYECILDEHGTIVDFGMPYLMHWKLFQNMEDHSFFRINKPLVLYGIPEVLNHFRDCNRTIGDWGESVLVNDHGNTRLFITREGLETTRRTINSRLIGRTYGFYGPTIDFLDKYGRERNIDYDNRVRFSYRRCRIEKIVVTDFSRCLMQG